MARTTQRTRHDQMIEAVATIIEQNLIYNEHVDDPWTEARRINRETGWGFEIRWVDQEYISKNDYTRVEGMVLSEKDLRAAYDLARAWSDSEAAGWPVIG